MKRKGRLSGGLQRRGPRFRGRRLGAYGCGSPWIVNARKVAYLSPILRASLYSAELRQALIFSMLSHCWIATRCFGGVPSIAVTFWPAARSLPPCCLMVACAFGAYSFW